MQYNTLSTSQHVKALKKQPPSEQEIKFLQAHFNATGRASTMTRLSKELGYSSYRAMNGICGGFAKRHAKSAGVTIPDGRVGIGIFVDFIEPHKLSNTDWILVMKPAFANALKQVGLV